jgi:integrase
LTKWADRTKVLSSVVQAYPPCAEPKRTKGEPRNQEIAVPKPLTASVVDKLRAPKGPAWAEVSDGAVRGLRLRISPKGEKRWSLMTTVGSRRVRHEIGAYPSVSLAEARERAKAFVSAAREGTSPEALERRQKVANMTVETAHAEYLAAVGPKLRATTLLLKRRMFENHIGPRLGDRPITQVRRAELVDLADRLAVAGFRAQVNRVLAEVVAMLRWCADRDWIEAVPTVGRSAKVKEKPRDRTLTDTEVAALWKATESVTATVRDYLRLLLLTGQRTEDVRAMAWAEVDLDAALWTIPEARYKTGRVQVVPLAPSVVAILRGRREVGEGPFVLAGRNPEKPWNGERNAADQLRGAMPEAAGFVFHDIRRTVRTGLVRLPGVSVDVAEAVIGHAAAGIVKVYDRHDRLEEKRKALEAWAAYVDAVVAKASGNNVVPLARIGRA